MNGDSKPKDEWKKKWIKEKSYYKIEDAKSLVTITSEIMQ